MNKQAFQELLPPLRRGSESEPSWFDWLTDPLPKRFMLPATGLLIMGLDWLLFSEEAASFGLLIPFTSLVGFLVGIPFPLAGTIVGGAILAASGLAGLRWRLLKSRFSRREPLSKSGM